MGEENNLTKAESTPSESNLKPKPEVGQPRVINGYSLIEENKKCELRPNNLIATFKSMLLDVDVADAVNTTLVKALPALNAGEVKPRSNSSKSINNAKFLNYVIRNISQGSWLEAMHNALTCLSFGYSLQLPVFEYKTSGQYKGKITLKKLAPRTQSSIYGWVWDDKGREVLGAIQKPMSVAKYNKNLKGFEAGKIPFSSITNGYYKDNKYVYLPSKRLLHFRFNPTDNSPQGYSQLFDCYDVYSEKKLIEQYEIIGASKDLGGIGVVSMPLDILNKAQDPENFPAEAQAYENYLENAANVQNARGNIMVVASDVDQQSKTPLYDFKMRGTDGGGKQYKTSEIIDIKRKSIYNTFGAGFKILGQGGHGSNALSDNQMSTHDYYVQRLLMWITDVINNQLLPMILEMNNIKLNWEDMPYFEADDPTKPSMEVLGKTASRLASSGLMTLAAAENLFEKMGLSKEGLEDIDFSSLGQNSSSEGSGNGNTQKEGMGSDTNNENAA